LESVAASDFNFGVTTLSCYTGKEFHTTPISGLGRVSARRSCLKSPFYFMPHLGGSLFGTGGLL